MGTGVEEFGNLMEQAFWIGQQQGSKYVLLVGLIGPYKLVLS